MKFRRVVLFTTVGLCLVAVSSCSSTKTMKKKEKKNHEVTVISDCKVSPFCFEKPIYKVGVVLSGGGARGFAHVGFFKAMEELGIKADIISGTSAGAIAGAMYSSGLSTDAMFSVFKDIRLLQVPRLFSRTSHTVVDEDTIKIKRDRGIVFSARALDRILRQTLPDSTFEKLKVPLVVNATNLEKGQNCYFFKGDLIRPVVASCSVPMVFGSVLINGDHYVDGGVMQNLAVSPIRKACTYVIAVHVNPLEDYSEQDKMHESEWERSLRLLIRVNILGDKDMADLFIEPKELVRYKMTDTNQGEEISLIGYREAKKALQDFIKLHPDIVNGVAQ